MSSYHEKRLEFERTNNVGMGVKLTFHGVEGYDVYNCSVPFYMNKKEYIFGRVERREEWSRSWTKLFERTGEDTYTVCEDSMIYQMEDPFITSIKGELILGGVHVLYHQNDSETYRTYYYKGNSFYNMYMFTSGPDYMKDIRLVDMDDGIGVFSRPRDESVKDEYGSDSIVGFVKIKSLDELSRDTINSARPIDGMFSKGEWGGPNQCFMLSNAMIGIIGHKCYKYKMDDGRKMPVYINMAWVFDMNSHKIVEEKIIASRNNYPKGLTKVFITTDTTFTSGITLRSDGRLNLYSGLNDIEEGRVVIDNPFKEYGDIILNNEFTMDCTPFANKMNVS